MNELQKEVAEALYWLRMLTMTVTALHSFTLLISRSFPRCGVPSAEPLGASQERIAKDLMIRITGREKLICQSFGLSRWLDASAKGTMSRSTDSAGTCKLTTR